jgi:ubiquinone/menaquinone biosynthesis C-methylase UbiE
MAGIAEDHPGQVGPQAYAGWRATTLGAITEDLERRLIFRFAGPLAGRNVLDVGCGDGGLAVALSRAGASMVTGCDPDRRMIAAASALAVRHKAQARFLISSAERLPFLDESFDIVTVVTVLCFVTEVSEAMREMARVLKPGGRLVIGDLGKWSVWAASRRIRARLGSPIWRSARFRSARELCDLTELAQLRVDRVAGAIYYPRVGLLAKLMAPVDPLLGRFTTLGAAFLAVQATKPD